MNFGNLGNPHVNGGVAGSYAMVDDRDRPASNIAGWPPLTRLSRDCGIATLYRRGERGLPIDRLRALPSTWLRDGEQRRTVSEVEV